MFEHCDTDSFAGVDSGSTYDVVPAHRLQMVVLPERPGDDLHGLFCAFTPQDFRAGANVHGYGYTKA